MNPYKARKMAKVIAIILVVAMVVTSFSALLSIFPLFGVESYTVYAADNGNISERELDEETETLQNYLKYIKEHYKDEVTMDMLVEGAFTGSVDILGDPFSMYYRNEEDRDKFVESIEGQYAGIGVELKIVNGDIVVDSVTLGSVAEKSGVKAEDIITHVDDLSIEGKSLNDAVTKLRGELNTTVSISVRREGKLIIFSMNRENVKLASVHYDMMDNGIGYIKISSFDNDTNFEFDLAKARLLEQGAQKFIIDIRNNLGGFVHTALNTAESLMPAGPIIHLESKGKIEETIHAKGVEKSYPIVLLINEYTGSSAEFFAGALQDSKTAILVGTQTYGKGVLQEIIRIGDNAFLKLSTNYILTPSKNRIDQIGIMPDYVVNNFNHAEKDRMIQSYELFAPMKEKAKPVMGDIGLNVYGAQQRLNMLGYKVEINGTMDYLTVTAIKNFQKQSNLNPYGVLDYTTQNTLDIAIYDKITGEDKEIDAQMEKAISLL